MPRERVLAMAQALVSRQPDSLPLYGIPFAIKDNIDLADMPTTAGCPDYAYTPGESAFVVQKLIDAGAIPVGKTNLDQFATGLVGTRSPYGACANSFNSAYVSGGSSAGSAVAVATGLVSFRSRDRYRGLGPGAGCIQQSDRSETHVWHPQRPRCRARVPIARLDFDLRPDSPGRAACVRGCPWV